MDLSVFVLMHCVKNHFPFLTSPLTQAAAPPEADLRPWKGLSHVPKAHGHPFQGVETVAGDVNENKCAFYALCLNSNQRKQLLQQVYEIHLVGTSKATQNQNIIQLVFLQIEQFI